MHSVDYQTSKKYLRFYDKISSSTPNFKKQSTSLNPNHST